MASFPQPALWSKVCPSSVSLQWSLARPRGCSAIRSPRSEPAGRWGAARMPALAMSSKPRASAS
eukprot:10745046-Alexandrium_andersonii.AAC.1